MVRAPLSSLTHVNGAQTFGFWRIRPLAPDVCDVTLLQQGEVGGSIPTWLMDKNVKYMLKMVAFLVAQFKRAPARVDEEVRASVCERGGLD